MSPKKRSSPKRTRVIMTRLLPPGLRDDGSFDRELWQRAGPDAIFAAMWEMVATYRKLRGLRGRQPQLRRHVVLVRRAG